MNLEQLMQDNGLTLIKSVFEIRYQRTFLFDNMNSLNQIARELKKDFPHTQKEPNGPFVLANVPDKCILGVLAESAAIDAEGPSLFSTFKNRALKAAEAVTKALEIDEYNRVGLRLFFGETVASGDVAKKTIKNSFLRLDEQKLGSEIQDPTLAFSFKEDDFFYTINIRTQSNMSFSFGSSINPSVTQQDMIIYDVDISSTKQLQSHNFNGFFSHASENAVNKVSLLKTM